MFEILLPVQTPTTIFLLSFNYVQRRERRDRDVSSSGSVLDDQTPTTTMTKTTFFQLPLMPRTMQGRRWRRRRRRPVQF